MATLEHLLDITALLDAAEQQLPSWGIQHPELGVLTTLDLISDATRTGTAEERDEVLLALAALANVEGGDNCAAAALLCHLLIPGVLSRLRGTRINSDELSIAAAEHLWIAARTFPWRSSHKVAANISWAVRRAVLADFGIGEIRRFDRTWAATAVCGQTELWKSAAPERSGQETAHRELAELLDWAESAAVLTGDEIELLIALIRASHRLPSRRVTSSGLLSADVSRAVGEQLGISASTVRRRVSRTLETLRCATRTRGYLSDLEFAA